MVDFHHQFEGGPYVLKTLGWQGVIQAEKTKQKIGKVLLNTKSFL
jgi:hypothetical protein